MPRTHTPAHALHAAPHTGAAHVFFDVPVELASQARNLGCEPDPAGHHWRIHSDAPFLGAIRAIYREVPPPPARATTSLPAWYMQGVQVLTHARAPSPLDPCCVRLACIWDTVMGLPLRPSPSLVVRTPGGIQLGQGYGGTVLFPGPQCFLTALADFAPPSGRTHPGLP